MQPPIFGGCIYIIKSAEQIFGALFCFVLLKTYIKR